MIIMLNIVGSDYKIEDKLYNYDYIYDYCDLNNIVIKGF